MLTGTLVSAVLRIVLIDLVLSGDNAIVIGMAAHRLPPPQRRLAILFGGGAAIVLRIALTAIAAQLLAIAGLQAVGGLLLLWIAFKLLKNDEESAEGVRAAAHLRGAVLTILLADFVMSLDNVLGVAAASEGNLVVLLFGLALSVAILMVGGSLIAGLINRLWWLSYVGSAVIAWTGAEMLLQDQLLGQIGHLPAEAELLAMVVVTALTVAIAHVVHRRPAHAA
jgi:YjbE family integral membrane protein